jgi:DNA-binding response OmpR family regulator
MAFDPLIPPGTGQTRRGNLLIVDDNPDAGDALCAELQMAGHQVWVVRSGVTAISHSALAIADAVLIDLGMPIMNGFNLARQIKRRSKDVLLIAITGWSRPGDLAAARDAGFDHYLTKPVDTDLLDSYVNAFVAAHPRARASVPSAASQLTAGPHANACGSAPA